MIDSRLFKAIRQRLRDAGTLKQLCFHAEALANGDGQREPGAEHFVLAALELPDSTARRALATFGIAPARFRSAIAGQYRSALERVGIQTSGITSFEDGGPDLPRARGPYRAQPSAQALMHVLTRDIMKAVQAQDATAPLLGVHVLVAACAAKRGVCARAFESIGVTPEALRAAARLAPDNATAH